MTTMGILPNHPRSSADWRLWLQHDLELATRTLVARGEVEHLFVLHESRGRVRTFRAGFYNADHRLAVIRFARVMCLAYDVLGFSCVAEAWIASASGREEALRVHAGEGLMPRERPDRREVVSVMLTYRSPTGKRRAMGAVREILRDAGGKPTGVCLFDGKPDAEDCDADPTVGSIASILTLRPPSRRVINDARDVLENVGREVMKELGMVEI